MKKLNLNNIAHILLLITFLGIMINACTKDSTNQDSTEKPVYLRLVGADGQILTDQIYIK